MAAPRGTIPVVVQSPVNGSAISGATVTVTKNSGGAAATIYTGATGAGNLGTNVITTDANGNCTSAGAELWLEVGTYNFQISGANLTTRVIVREIVSGDGLGQVMPVGGGMIWYTSVAPAGFLLCQGQFVVQASYPKLFALLAHTANGGTDPLNGTFRLPDLQQRFPLGKSAAGTGATLLGAGGAIDHGHITPAHYHAVVGNGADFAASGGSHGHTTVSTTVSSTYIPDHDHAIGYAGSGSSTVYALALVTNGGARATGQMNADGHVTHDHIVPSLTVNGNTHSHPNGDFSGRVGKVAGGVSGDIGLSTDGNNPPFYTVHYAIRHGD